MRSAHLQPWMFILMEVMHICHSRLFLCMFRTDQGRLLIQLLLNARMNLEIWIHNIVADIFLPYWKTRILISIQLHPDCKPAELDLHNIS